MIIKVPHRFYCNSIEIERVFITDKEISIYFRKGGHELFSLVEESSLPPRGRSLCEFNKEDFDILKEQLEKMWGDR